MERRNQCGGDLMLLRELLLRDLDDRFAQLQCNIQSEFEVIKKQLADSGISSEMFDKLRVVADSQDALESKLKDAITPSQPST